ncbi:MAG TPA: glycerol-3-phosphate dehydrogenase/oxidase [Gemmatimonadaceae bacterium]|jgi:glycerol-3-phosphate dehydrogenase|nr:glycerol-3-phosphate dehydrogenase/oxidase [Gemmatimonadaceae bacterium]
MQARVPTRPERLEALGSRQFDLLVIGGGITGCGIAYEAVSRGLAVALVDKADFAWGTSSRSSRLVHGGVRYLEHGHIHLVFESSAERHALLRVAPHLVRPLEFTWPVYEGARISRWKLGAGLFAYDALALFRNVARHRRLSHDAVLEREPALQPAGLKGGASYFDAATDDARLTLANALGAAEAGAVIVNHVGVTRLIVDDGHARGAVVEDQLGGSQIEVHARMIVNATGPWSDELRSLDGNGSPAVHGSKGAHVAVPRARLGNRRAVTMISPEDGRVLFALPAGAFAIVGTTETETRSRPDEVRASHDDIRYLLAAANWFFPTSQLHEADVVSAWAGIRPLVAHDAVMPGALSREHAIQSSKHGVVSITGGKLTTYRVMARDVIESMFGKIRAAPATKARPLPGGDFDSLPDLVGHIAETTRDAALAEHLAASFGTRWRDVWGEMASDTSRIVDELPYTFGELRYCARSEMAETIGDLLIRRTHLAFETRDHGMNVASRVAEAVAPTLGWDERATKSAVDAYEREVRRIFTVE